MYKAPFKTLHVIFTLLLVTLATACVYEVDVQQGNKLEPQDIEAVEVGMTRNQVRYLLAYIGPKDPARAQAALSDVVQEFGRKAE